MIIAAPYQPPNDKRAGKVQRVARSRGRRSMYPTFKSARQARTRQTAQEQSNSSSARSARCNDGQSSQDLLTQREQQIANLLAAGLTNKQIAREISIAEGTVKVHLHNAYQKRSVSNRLSLALDAERASMAFHAAILPALPGALSSLLFASVAPHLVRADEVLFRGGDVGDGCYRLEKGLLKILVTSPEGEEPSNQARWLASSR